MDFPPHSFESYQHGFEPDTSTYHGHQVFNDFENGCVNNYDFPTQNGLPQPTSSWDQPPMQRFLNDTQRASLCNPLLQQTLPLNTRPVGSMPPVASHLRQESPFSSHEFSSSSSVQSPGADTDLFSDNMPPTPPDMGMGMFTSFQGSPYEPYQPQSPLFLSGMGGFPVDSRSCVSMAQHVDTVDESSSDWKASPGVVDFSSPPRTYTFASQASFCIHIDEMSRQSSIEHDYKHAASPALSAVVKEEATLPEHLAFPGNMSGSYPTPSIGDSEGSDAEIDVASPVFAEDEDYDDHDDDDDDDEYRPNNKKPASPTIRRTQRNKRDAPRSLDKSSSKRVKTGPSSIAQPARQLPPSPTGNRGSFQCTECSYSFNDDMTLQSHVKKQHTRPFVCVFRFAGCGSTFASKNEWKRHVMSQHLVLHYWLCDIDACADNKNSLTSPKPTRRNRARRSAEHTTLGLEPVGPPLPDGAIFNRKDLYTQHIRRMHTPAAALPAASNKSPSSKKTAAAAAATTSAAAAAAAWEDQVKALQTSAVRERCQLPVYMACPAPHCTVSFNGVDAWDQRMEHVARHLERASLRHEEQVVFGGPADPSLMSWVTHADVAVVRAVGPGCWVLDNPLRAASEGRGVGRKREVSVPSSVSLSGGATAASSSAGSVSAVSFSGASSPFIKNEICVGEGDEDEDAEGEEE